MNIKKWFKRKTDSKEHEQLDLYNKKPEEPESSVMASLDYDFAVSSYSKDDFRYEFINAYIAYVKDHCDKSIYNCRFERPLNNAKFLNLYIYTENPDSDVKYLIDDPKHEYILAFYEVLKRCNLPGITIDTRIQFILKDIVKIMKATAVAKAWQDIHDKIKILFPECAVLSSWGIHFYVFILSDRYEKLIKDEVKLEQIKKFCYESVKQCDDDNVWKYEEYNIMVDNYKTYHEIGGYNYFNSDEMNKCRCI